MDIETPVSPLVSEVNAIRASEGAGHLQGKSLPKAPLSGDSQLITSAQFSPVIFVAQVEHLSTAKQLADKHKHELGFINRTILQKAIESRSLLVAPCPDSEDNAANRSELAGMVHFYVRRDDVVTLYNIVVASAYQRRGLGRRLFEELVILTRSLGKMQIRLKCPAELPANLFYERLGLERVAVEPGKHRPLNVWVYTL